MLKRLATLLAPVLLAVVLLGVFGKAIVKLSPTPPNFWGDPFGEGLTVQGQTVMLNLPTQVSEEFTPFAIVYFNLPPPPSSTEHVQEGCGDNDYCIYTVTCRGILFVFNITANATVKVSITHGGVCGLLVERDYWQRFSNTTEFHPGFTHAIMPSSSDNDYVSLLTTCRFVNADYIYCYDYDGANWVFKNASIVEINGIEWVLYMVNSSYWYSSRREGVPEIDIVAAALADNDYGSNIFPNETTEVIINRTAGETWKTLLIRLPYMKNIVPNAPPRDRLLNVYPVYCFTFIVENLDNASAQVNITVAKVELTEWTPG